MDTGNNDTRAILEAVEAGDVKTLQPLLKANPSIVNVPFEPDGRSTKLRPTLLHRANCGTFASYKGPAWHAGHLQVAQMLIDHGADINSTVDGCMPPLEIAVWSRNPEMAELLIANGADVELHTEAPPVEVAVLNDRRDIFKLLIAAGAKYDISHTLRLGILRETRALLKADPSLANTETAHGLPLNLAVSKPGIFKLLLRHGADIHAVDSFGLTSLKASRIPESDKVVQTLLEMGVEDDIYGAMVGRDEAKVTAILKVDPTQAQPVASWAERGPLPPVIWAIWSGSTRILQLILQQDVPLDFVPNPLSIAIQYHYDEMVRLLLDHGASPECEYPGDWPGVFMYPPYRPQVHVPLYHALRHGTTTSVEMLLEAGADPTSTLTNWAGLQWPAYVGDVARVKLLIDRGADLTSPCAKSALRFAIQNCRRPVVELLVAHGVEIDATYGDERSVRNLIGQSDYRPAREEKARTVVQLEEFVTVAQMPKRERERVLRHRAQLIDSVIDGDVEALRQVQKEVPELFERKLVTEELLHYAARQGHDDVVDWLVAQGAPMTISAATALGRAELVAAMLDADPPLLEGALPPEVTEKKKHLPWQEYSPLVIAATNNWIEIVRLLLDRGAEINRQVGWYQNTALHLAVRSHSTETVRLLLARGADVTIRSRDHHLPTPLQKNRPPTVSRDEIRDLLIAHGAKPEEVHPHSA
jgi:ankyrin repeat protein